MPKPAKVRETSNPIGIKINMIMLEKGIPGEYAALASVFGVKPPSVYDWIDHGRIGKNQYQQLVDWSGRPLEWWFDIKNNNVLYPHVEESFEAGRFALNDSAGQHSNWPFKRVTPSRLVRLEASLGLKRAEAMVDEMDAILDVYLSRREHEIQLESDRDFEPCHRSATAQSHHMGRALRARR